MIVNKRTSIEWTSYLACAYAEGFCEGDNATAEEQLEAWAYILDNDLHLSLQGWYGRSLQGLLDNHILNRDKEGVTIDWEQIDNM